MRRFVLLAPIALVLAVMLGGTAQADRNGIVRFATLPSGPGHPEGITADPDGNIYAASFSFTPPNYVYKFDSRGRLEATVTLPNSIPLGMQWGPDGRLYVDDFGRGDVLQFTPPITSTSTPSDTFHVCSGGGSTCGLNAIAFRGALLYTSDSFGGRIFRFNPAGPRPVLDVPYIADDLLRPGGHGFPPFGANGLAFSASGDLYVANTADDRILKIANGSATPVPYVQSVNGADGIGFDPSGRLWACANQENTLYVIDVTNASEGRVADIRGMFEGIDASGTPHGLLFPASIVFSRGSAFVTNTALDFRHHFVGERPVTRFTISRVPLGRGGGDNNGGNNGGDHQD
jgi:sugar lactone lactonase YvrE